MLSVGEAQERILSHFRPVEAETIPLGQSSGRVLAEDILASIDLPLFDNSSVDGFAVRASDVATAAPKAPVSLRVVADIPAGSATEVRIGTGQAARIMTGAPLPAGAEAVVMVEDTDFADRSPGTPAPESVRVFRPVPVGACLRRSGEDLRLGERVLAAGRRLQPQDIGLLAMLGVDRVAVRRRPRLAILSSGDELIPVEAPLTPGKVRDANSYTLQLLAEKAGAEVIPLGIVPDDLSAVRTLLDRAVQASVDAIVASAGVSVGAYDFVRAAVEADGSLDFWKVNMRPGKPLAFGEVHGIPFFGLPGNPVSAFVGFLVFVRPALERLGGLSSQGPRLEMAILAEAVESDGRESYLRAVAFPSNGRRMVRLTGHQGSGNLLSLVQANALLIVPSGVKSLPANKEVSIWPIE